MVHWFWFCRYLCCSCLWLCSVFSVLFGWVDHRYNDLHNVNNSPWTPRWWSKCWGEVWCVCEGHCRSGDWRSPGHCLPCFVTWCSSADGISEEGKSDDWLTQLASNPRELYVVLCLVCHRVCHVRELYVVVCLVCQRVCHVRELYVVMCLVCHSVSRLRAVRCGDKCLVCHRVCHVWDCTFGVPRRQPHRRQA